LHGIIAWQTVESLSSGNDIAMNSKLSCSIDISPEQNLSGKFDNMLND